jgi:hypothetical protein
MKRETFVVVLAAALMVSACATKRYPIATPLSPAEASLMDCDDLELELLRAEQVRRQITETAETDWRSVAGFLGDYGIGNAMAKSEAERALSDRIQTVREAQAAKDCDIRTLGSGRSTG